MGMIQDRYKLYAIPEGKELYFNAWSDRLRVLNSSVPARREKMQLRENALRQDEDYIACVTWLDITAVCSEGGGVNKNPVNIH